MDIDSNQSQDRTAEAKPDLEAPLTLASDPGVTQSTKRGALDRQQARNVLVLPPKARGEPF